MGCSSFAPERGGVSAKLPLTQGVAGVVLVPLPEFRLVLEGVEVTPELPLFMELGGL